MALLNMTLRFVSNTWISSTVLNNADHRAGAYFPLMRNFDLVKTCLLPYLGILFILVFLALISLLCRHLKTARRFPPGPAKLPVLGNIHQFPRRDIWKLYQAWHQKFGPIIHTKFGQMTVISVGSFKVAKDLLDKRSPNYSSRPQLPVANYINRGLHTALLPLNDRLRVHQALLSTILSPRMVQGYRHLQDIESRQLLHELLNPENVSFRAMIHRYTYSVTLTLAYGRRLRTANDDLIQQIHSLATSVAENIHKPTSLMVGVFPVLEWLPRVLAPWRDIGDRLFAKSINLFEDLLWHGISQDSWNWTKTLSLLNNERYQLTRQELAFLLGSTLEASDTTDKVLEFFIMACILHKQNVRRAQKELESVVGPGRLPEFEDMARLPYVNAFVLEVMRWRPITPLGVPHAVVNDDQYEGYHIPKGAMILANHWCMNFDKEVFEHPNDFRPERWLQNANLPVNAFGFGKRSCPGQHLGRRSLFIVSSRLLWAFEISHAVDRDGKIRDVDSSDLLQSALTGPKCLEASFTVRSPERQRIIEDSFNSVDFDVDSIMSRIRSESNTAPPARSTY